MSRFWSLRRELRIKNLTITTDNQVEVVAAWRGRRRRFRIDAGAWRHLYELHGTRKGVVRALRQILSGPFRKAVQEDPALNIGLELRWNVVQPNRVGRDWLDTVGCFIPRSIREPWLGDLRQDQKRMADEGCNRFFIACATASQLVCAAVAVVRGIIKDAVSLLRMG